MKRFLRKTKKVIHHVFHMLDNILKELITIMWLLVGAYLIYKKAIPFLFDKLF